MIRRAFCVVLGLLTVSISPVAASELRSPPAKGVVLGAGYGLAADDFGYFVVDVADGSVVAGHNADRPFMPASVVKIPTTMAALDVLGDQHRFETTVLVEGNIEGGVLKGDLTLRGGGDPSLAGNDLKFLAQEIARSGIKKVAGGFHYDATSLIETPQINGLQPQAAGYNPAVSALSVNFNRIRVKWRRSAEGVSGEAMAVSDELTVPLKHVNFSRADAALPGPIVRAGEISDDSWVLSPDLSPEGEDWLPLGNPALVAAEMLHLFASEQGIELPEATPRAAGPQAREIARHSSEGLSEVVREVLRYSNNMTAELVGLAASRSLAAQASVSLEASAAVLRDWWKEKLPEVNWDGFFLENQSGLSSKSHATPRQLVAMLTYAAGRSSGTAFHDLLRAASWKAPNGKTVNIRAKTGTIAYGRGLAGYIEAADGRRLAFAVFFNDKEKRAAMDAAFDPRAKSDEATARPWRNRALRLEEMLVTGWATGSWK